MAKRKSRDIRSRSPKLPASTRHDATPPAQGKIRLKPVLQQIEVSLDQLKRLKQQTDRVKYAIEQLQASQKLLAAICTDRGCGSDMAFPPDA